jgi:hypothetical protein
MLEAIATLLDKTLATYLLLRSPEAKKRRLGKEMLELYTALGRAAHALDDLLDHLKLRPAFKSYLSDDLARFSKAVMKISGIISADVTESLYPRGQSPEVLYTGDPKRLRAVTAYDPEKVGLILTAWTFRGGFVRALRRNHVLEFMRIVEL